MGSGRGGVRSKQRRVHARAALPVDIADRTSVERALLVNAIAPVITETDLFKEMTAQHIVAMKAKIPMGRFLRIEEIAAMVVWIASPECTFTTGSTFDLSGGRATY